MKQCWCGNQALQRYSDTYSLCDKCRTLISNAEVNYDPEHISDNGGDLYGKDYWQVKMAHAAGVSSLDELVDLYLRERAVYWLEAFLPYCLPSDGSVAEVGCGLGQFSYFLNRLGYDQLAFELSPKICQYVRDTLHINIHCSAFSARPSRYRAVVALDLFEHLTEPVDFLTAVRQSLTEDGILMLQMPNYDPSLSYAEMRQKAPRFESLLLPEEHVFLYSKDSVSKLLRSCGFTDVRFLPAFFGDDYDMFLVASPSALCPHTEEEVAQALNAAPNGRLLKTILYLKKNQLQERQNTAILEKACAERLALIERLDAQLKESEADRAARLTTIEQLDAHLRESEADRAAHLALINRLDAQLRESEADRAARLALIEQLDARLKESEADRAGQAERIRQLEKLLSEAENRYREEIQRPLWDKLLHPAKLPTPNTAGIDTSPHEKEKEP